MMRVGTLHRYALTTTAALGTIGVMRGSLLLLLSGLVLLIIIVAQSHLLLETVRSSRRARTVHLLTVLLLILAILTFPRARIDAVLLVAMLGIFNRFLLRSGQRDDLIIVGAACVLLAASTTVTPGIGFLVIILCFVPSLLWALWAASLIGMGEKSGEVSTPAERHAQTRFLAQRTVPRCMGRIALGGIGFMICGYFVVSLLPRYNFARFLSPGYLLGLPGSERSMRLNIDGVPDINDSTVVMRVRPHPHRDQASLEGLYARVHGLDRFDGQVWSTSADIAPVRLYEHPETINVSKWEGSGTNTVRVTFDRLERGARHPVATLGRIRPSFILLDRLGRRPLSGTYVYRGLWPGVGLDYLIDLDRPGKLAPVLARTKMRQQERWVSLPEGLDARVVALGKQLTEDKATPEGRVKAVLRHFDHRFAYSLEPLSGTSDDPLVRFLFEAKRGHCELYAGAVVALLRAGGVPSRVATGFYGGWWNDVGGYLEFTNQDAHAWAEVLIDGEWRWIDATPSNLRARRKEKPLAWIGDLYDAFSAAWFDYIIDFDDNKRKRFLSSISTAFALPEIFSASDGDTERSGTVIPPILFFLGPFLLLFSLLLYLLWRRHQRAPETIGRRLRRLLGERQEENATLGMLLSRVPPRAGPAAEHAIRVYEAFRFGPETTASNETELQSALRRLKQAMR